MAPCRFRDGVDCVSGDAAAGAGADRRRHSGKGKREKGAAGSGGRRAMSAGQVGLD